MLASEISCAFLFIFLLGVFKKPQQCEVAPPLSAKGGIAVCNCAGGCDQVQLVQSSPELCLQPQDTCAGSFFLPSSRSNLEVRMGERGAPGVFLFR